MNSNQNRNVGNVIIKSHPKSYITIVPIDSIAFNKLFNCNSPSITYPVKIGNDITKHVVILQATVCDKYAIIEYVSEVDYFYSREARQNNG